MVIREQAGVQNTQSTEPDWQRVSCIDWLRHPWTFEIRESFDCGKSTFHVHAHGVGVVTLPTAEAAREWVSKARPTCLAELIARYSSFHPALVIIDSGGRKRLGRIRPELWGSYDGFEVNRTEKGMTILSAKARAAFPNEFAVFVRVCADRKV